MAQLRPVAQTAGIDGYLEVLDRSRSVVDRLRVQGLPISVGRAYDNDLVLADGYVSPHHLRIDVDSNGALFAEDLDSLNGLFRTGHRGSCRRAWLGDGAPIRIGHTRLRFRPVDFPVEPTLTDPHTRKLLGMLERRWVQAGVFLVTLLTIWMSGYLDSAERREAVEPVFEMLAPSAAIIVWAGLWGFAGRVITHRAKFVTHCAIVSAALSLVLMVDGLFDYVAFAVSIDSWRGTFSVFAGILLAIAMLYAHLRFATLSPPWRLAGVSSILAFSVAGVLLLKSHVDSDDFSVTPQIHATLKAPAFQLRPGLSSSDFFGNLGHLRDSVTAERQPD